MADQITKIHIKLGQIEINYEGDSSYLGDNLTQLIEKLMELKIPSAQFGENLDTLQQPSGNLSLSTNSIAAKLGVKSATDLTFAGCAYLTLTMKLQTFSRQQILDAIKSASTYYNANAGKNLTQSINTLIKDGKLLERSADKYALHADTIKSLELTLGK